MNKLKSLIILCLATFSLSVAQVSAAEMGATDKPIKLALNDWTGQHLATMAAGRILERAGYKVEYVTAGFAPQYIALGEGDLHAQVEVWTSNLPGQYNEVADKGLVKDIGSLGPDAREGFLYPAHMKEICPGLPDWKALNACAEKFATVETLPKGRLLDYPADWGSPGKDRFEALKINFAAVPAGSEGALITELEASIQKKSPLLMTFWQPHWVFGAYDIEWVALPAGEEACYEDASWGVNPDVTGDCDFLPGRIFKVVWSGFDETWPLAGKLLKDYTMSTSDQQQMMSAVDFKGEDIDVVIDAYIAEKASAIDSMIASAKSS